MIKCREELRIFTTEDTEITEGRKNEDVLFISSIICHEILL